MSTAEATNLGEGLRAITQLTALDFGPIYSGENLNTSLEILMCEPITLTKLKTLSIGPSMLVNASNIRALTIFSPTLTSLQLPTSNIISSLLPELPHLLTLHLRFPEQIDQLEFYANQLQHVSFSSPTCVFKHFSTSLSTMKNLRLISGCILGANCNRNRNRNPTKPKKQTALTEFRRLRPEVEIQWFKALRHE